MVQLILICFLSLGARAQFLGFGGKGIKSKVAELAEKLKSIDMKATPAYEDSFNQAVKGIENQVEEEKLYCSGESVDGEGKLLPADKKQLCMRELKKHYLDATAIIFDVKKKYLELIHSRQVERMEEIHARLKSNIEKNF